MSDLPLKTALLDLLYETRETDLKLIIGGGYGIFLKRQHARENGARTLLQAWPEARSTNDIDLFLRPELLIRTELLEPLAPALERLGYKVIEGAENFQFAKPGPTGGRDRSLKFDLLTGPRSRFAGARVRIDKICVRPRMSVGVHANFVDEALTLEEGLLPIRLVGMTTAGQEHSAQVYLPHPLTFAMMKLFALRDRATGEKRGGDDAKRYGRYHALDLYTVIATASEAEWDQALELRNRYRGEAVMVEAVAIVKELFANPTSLGMIRMQESGYYRDDLQMTDFLEALHELFNVG